MMKLARNIILASIAAVAASCSDDTLPGTNPDNGEKTPLNVAVALSNGSPLSRAEGKTFATNDELIARIRQVEWDQATDPNFQSVTEKAADQSPRTVKFTVTSNDMTVVDDNTQQTSYLTASSYWNGTDWAAISGGKLYWDDFSTASDPLTADGRYLQSAWGFCYNGGTPSTALSQTDGTIGWTAAADFTTDGVLRKNDLLWSKAQKPLKYVRGTFAGNDHGTLVIPYTHAMSMITIEVVAAEGFKAGDLGSTTATLQAMYTKATFSAPDATVSGQIGSQSVAMLAGTEGTNGGKPNKVFQALVIPGKELALNATLAEITNIDGNNYKIPVTQTILDAWDSQLDSKKLKSGVNYKLTVTVAKQAISVVAQITDWTIIEATGKGEINFSADVTSSGVANGATGSFDLYRGTTTTPEAEGALAYATTSTWSTDKWANNPEIYWANGSTSYFFRALATYNGTSLSSINNAFTTEGEMARTAAAQGKDLMWATTKEHDGNLEGGGTQHFNASEAIPPRTGDVPLQFEHAMSKITINLSTSTTGKDEATQSLDEKARAVDFTGAKITISNLCTKGTIAIANGAITPTALLAEAPTSLQQNVTTETGVKDKGSISEIVIPQSLLEKTIGETDNCPIKLTITLSDGTTYSLLLKDCKVKDYADNFITTWERGKHYVYEIYVEKEAISFVAVIKEWEEVKGSGDANLDWD